MDPVTSFSWHQFKLDLAAASAIDMDAWHVLIGVLVFLALARLTNRGIAMPLPWLLLLAIELANEGHDLHVERWPNFGDQLGEAMTDVALTMALPTLLMLVARLNPALLVDPDPDPS